jgi:hypothetical protein
MIVSLTGGGIVGHAAVISRQSAGGSEVSDESGADRDRPCQWQKDGKTDIAIGLKRA